MYHLVENINTSRIDLATICSIVFLFALPIKYLQYLFFFIIF
jgi:hypothetical protein